MYTVLLILHSLFRWLLLVTVVIAICRSVKGIYGKKPFSKIDNSFRHWTATIGHIQLMIGIWLYTISPAAKVYFSAAKAPFESLFFAIIHTALMVTAIIVLTIGSAKAKRTLTDDLKFRTQLFWFSAALLIILIAISWPFSPFAHRPFLRL